MVHIVEPILVRILFLLSAMGIYSKSFISGSRAILDWNSSYIEEMDYPHDFGQDLKTSFLFTVNETSLTA